MPKISQLPPEENPTPDDEFVMVDKALGITKKVTGENISGAFGDESIEIEKVKNLSTSLNDDGTLKDGIIGLPQLSDTGWNSLTLNAGYSGYVNYRRVGGFVTIIYEIDRTTGTSTANAGAMPVGFRPDIQLNLPSSTGANYWIQPAANGSNIRGNWANGTPTRGTFTYPVGG